MADYADYEETLFIKYRDCVNVIGKRVLLKLLFWFYKGGETSYLDYLSREYDLPSISHLINTSYTNDLKNKTPEYFEMTLIHNLLKLTCNLYDNKTQKNRKDKRYTILERDINKIVHLSENLLSLSPILDLLDLRNRIYELTETLMNMTEMGCSLSGGNTTERNNLVTEINIDTMKIFNRTKDHWYLDDKCSSRSQKYDFSNVKHTSVPSNNIKDVCMEILAKSDDMSLEECKGKMGDVIASYNDNILKNLRQEESVSLRKAIEHKNTQTLLASLAAMGAIKKSHKTSKSKKDSGAFIQIEKTASHSSTQAKKSASHKKSMPVGQKTSSSSSSISSEIISSASRTEDTKNISSSKESVENRNKALVSDNYTTKDIKLIQSKICAALGPGKCHELQKPEGFSPLSLHTYTDISLNQHQRYSCKPGHQVRLRDLFNVEGMNNGSAEIILVSGEAGMGKTWLMKYIEEKWRGDQTAVDKLASWDLLIPYELQKDRCSSFTQLASNLLKDQIRDIGEDLFNEAVLDLPMLVTLDGYDESCENSCQLVEDVLKMSGTDLRVIITSRPQYVDFIYEQVPNHRREHVSHLCLNGIPPHHHADFVARVIDSRQSVRKDNVQLEKVKEGLINRLPDIYEAIGEDLCNPLMLEIITAMWMEHPHDELNVEVKHLVV